MLHLFPLRQHVAQAFHLRLGDGDSAGADELQDADLLGQLVEKPLRFGVMPGLEEHHAVVVDLEHPDVVFPDEVFDGPVFHNLIGSQFVQGQLLVDQLVVHIEVGFEHIDAFVDLAHQFLHRFFGFRENGDGELMDACQGRGRDRQGFDVQLPAREDGGDLVEHPYRIF